MLMFNQTRAVYEAADAYALVRKKGGSHKAAEAAARPILKTLLVNGRDEIEIAKAAVSTSPASSRTLREAAAARVARQDQEAAEKAKKIAPVVAEIDELLKSQPPRARELYEVAVSKKGIAAHVAGSELARIAPELGEALVDLSKAAGLPSPKLVAAAQRARDRARRRQRRRTKDGQDQKVSPLVKAAQARADELTADTAGSASPLVKAAKDRAKQLNRGTR